MNDKLQEFETYIKQRKIAIIGMGVSNIPLIDYFYNLGAKITLFDKHEFQNISEEVVDKIKKYGLEYSFGENSMSKLAGFDMIFRSPSCRPDLPELEKERENGTIITSEIEMLLKLCPGTVIGITGSDGKSTTTTLIYEMLKENGYSCYLGGNIGIPLFTKVKEMYPQDYIVLELSSFQLMDMEVSPDISVITNVSPNHLDIHKSYEEYQEAKKNIFRYQTEKGITVLNYDNDITRNMGTEVPGKVVWFSSKEKLEDGIIYNDGKIKSCKDNVRKHILDTKDLYLRGIHNYENIAAAIGATQNLIDSEIQKKAVKNFKGVKHRLEFIREIEGAKWYNDSIGTSPTRTIAGLNSFDESIILIAGGYDKHLDYTPIAKPILEKVDTLILMGATADKIEAVVKKEMKQQKKKLDIYRCNTLQETVEIAYQKSKKGDVVLFSPASASFDLFKNFEERGNIFKDIVNNI